MKKTMIVVGLVTLFAFFYQLSPWLGVPEDAILAMFIASPFLVLFMVYYILRHGTPSSHTFEERFYDDVEK